MTESPIYNTYKKRASIVYPLEDVEKEQVAKTWAFFNSINHHISFKNVNDLIIHIMNIPELISSNINVRTMFIDKVNKILTNKYLPSHLNIDVVKTITDYFGWLKLRSDYVETEEERKERIVSNTQRIKQELIEKFYYPDRCDRMLLTYGDVWVHTHFE
jgi:cyclopropane fatty-acyl-phospholipid synthase-like methyltransferase